MCWPRPCGRRAAPRRPGRRAAGGVRGGAAVGAGAVCRAVVGRAGARGSGCGACAAWRREADALGPVRGAAGAGDFVLALPPQGEAGAPGVHPAARRTGFRQDAHAAPAHRLAAPRPRRRARAAAAELVRAARAAGSPPTHVHTVLAVCTVGARMGLLAGHVDTTLEALLRGAGGARPAAWRRRGCGGARRTCSARWPTATPTAWCTATSLQPGAPPCAQAAGWRRAQRARARRAPGRRAGARLRGPGRWLGLLLVWAGVGGPVGAAGPGRLAAAGHRRPAEARRCSAAWRGTTGRRGRRRRRRSAARGCAAARRGAARRGAGRRAPPAAGAPPWALVGAGHRGRCWTRPAPRAAPSCGSPAAAAAGAAPGARADAHGARRLAGAARAGGPARCGCWWRRRCASPGTPTPWPTGRGGPRWPGRPAARGARERVGALLRDGRVPPAGVRLRRVGASGVLAGAAPRVAALPRGRLVRRGRGLGRRGRARRPAAPPGPGTPGRRAGPGRPGAAAATRAGGAGAAARSLAACLGLPQVQAAVQAAAASPGHGHRWVAVVPVHLLVEQWACDVASAAWPGPSRTAGGARRPGTAPGPPRALSVVALTRGPLAGPPPRDGLFFFLAPVPAASAHAGRPHRATARAIPPPRPHGGAGGAPGRGAARPPPSRPAAASSPSGTSPAGCRAPAPRRACRRA